MDASETVDLSVMLISERFLRRPWQVGELLRIMAQPGKMMPILYLVTFDDLRTRVEQGAQVRHCTNAAS